MEFRRRKKNILIHLMALATLVNAFLQQTKMGFTLTHKLIAVNWVDFLLCFAEKALDILQCMYNFRLQLAYASVSIRKKCTQTCMSSACRYFHWFEQIAAACLWTDRLHLLSWIEIRFRAIHKTSSRKVVLVQCPDLFEQHWETVRINFSLKSQQSLTFWHFF